MMLKVCSSCKQEKEANQFSFNPATKDGLRSTCKVCGSAASKKWHENNKERRVETIKAWKQQNRSLINATNFAWRHSETGAVSELLAAAKKRAKQQGVPFNLTAADIEIPQLCPVFQQPLIRKTGKGPSPWSPTLDKIIPSLGYVAGNVRILSHRANAMKNAASPKELLMFAAWIQSTTNMTGDLV